MALARVHGSEAGASFDILARFESEDTRSHAEVMAPFAHAALQEAGVRGEELDAILTGTGSVPIKNGYSLRAGEPTRRKALSCWSPPMRAAARSTPHATASTPRATAWWTGRP